MKKLRDTFAKKGNVAKYANNYKLNVFEIAYLTEEQIKIFQSDFGIISDYFVKRRKGYKTIENHKPIKHVDEMLKFMRIFAEDEIVIAPIYKMVKEYPEDTERDIYQRLN